MRFKHNTYGMAFGAGGRFGGLQFGATASGRPPVQEFINKGYIVGKLCEAKPKGVYQSGGYQWVDSSAYPEWVQGPYKDDAGATYIHYWNQTSGDQFWVYQVKSIPCGGNASSDPTLTVTDPTTGYIKQVQKALNAAGVTDYEGKKLVVDGAPGPRTCSAAATFQSTLTSATEAIRAKAGLLGADFFNALGLDGALLEPTIGAMCAKHNDQGLVLIESPEPVATTTPSAPEPDLPVVEPTAPLVTEKKAGFPVWLGVLIGGTLIGMAWRARNKKKGGILKRRSKARRKRRR